MRKIKIRKDPQVGKMCTKIIITSSCDGWLAYSLEKYWLGYAAKTNICIKKIKIRSYKRDYL